MPLAALVVGSGSQGVAAAPIVLKLDSPGSAEVQHGIAFGTVAVNGAKRVVILRQLGYGEELYLGITRSGYCLEVKFVETFVLQ